MKQLTPEERQKIEARYELLDLGYLVLRQAAYFQRRALERGDYEATLHIDAILMNTSKSVSGCWASIQAFLIPPAAPAADPDPEPEPTAAAKETIQ